jgi:hypothetical protein
MSIDVIDLIGLAHQEKRRKNIFNTPRFHAWMHYYQPGQKDEMHSQCRSNFLRHRR